MIFRKTFGLFRSCLGMKAVCAASPILLTTTPLYPFTETSPPTTTLILPHNPSLHPLPLGIQHEPHRPFPAPLARPLPNPLIRTTRTRNSTSSTNTTTSHTTTTTTHPSTRTHAHLFRARLRTIPPTARTTIDRSIHPSTTLCPIPALPRPRRRCLRLDILRIPGQVSARTLFVQGDAYGEEGVEWDGGAKGSGCAVGGVCVEEVKERFFERVLSVTVFRVLGCSWVGG